MSLDLSKPIRTRDGRAVTLYHTFAPGVRPIHGRIEGVASPYGWTEKGRYSSDFKSNVDLINYEPSIHVQGYVVVWQDGTKSFWSGFSHMSSNLRKTVAAIIPIDQEVQHGQGLDLLRD